MLGVQRVVWNTIAMSRSLGAVVEMSRSQGRSNPACELFEAANIRSVVDLPQPDGPTSTMKLPSADVQVHSATAAAGAWDTSAGPSRIDAAHGICSCESWWGRGQRDEDAADHALMKALLQREDSTAMAVRPSPRPRQQ